MVPPGIYKTGKDGSTAGIDATNAREVTRQSPLVSRGLVVQRTMTECLCIWCDTAFTPRETGGSLQIFCSAQCRKQFHAACRVWAEDQVWRGLVPVSALRRAAGQHLR